MRPVSIFGFARCLMGSALLLAPDIVATSWVGSRRDRDAVRVYSRATGVRELLLGAATISSPQELRRPLLLAGALCDGVDFARSRAQFFSPTQPKVVDWIGRAGRCEDEPAVEGEAPRAEQQAPGTASVQESLALVGIVARLLARAQRAAVAEDDGPADDESHRYEVWVDPAAAEAPYSDGDELFEARPMDLAREVDLPLTIETTGGHVSTISLTLPRFESSAYLRRYRGVESVSIEMSLSPARRRLKLHPTNCFAME